MVGEKMKIFPAKYRCFSYKLKQNQGGGRFLPGKAITLKEARKELTYWYQGKLLMVNPILGSIE